VGAGADPASKVRGAISVNLVVKSHYGFTTTHCKIDEVYFATLL